MVGNLTVVHSHVDLGEIETAATSKSRPLQGPSPYAVNFQVGYDNFVSETAAAVLFNIFGRRIRSVGSFGLLDVYEEARPSLDIVGSQRFGRVKVAIKAKNLLNTPYLFTQAAPDGAKAQRIWETYRRGAELGVALSVDLE